MAKEYSLRTVTEDELEQEAKAKEPEREEYVYPDGKNAAWVEAGVNGWALFRIATKIGRPPKELSGLFTTESKAKLAIQAYIESLKEDGSKERADQRGLFEGASDGKQRSNVSA